ncbi:hypothetical protein GGR57DRAFT_55871 [Xylariaceae sp. FL1272]|nr:hypothetical protein GGR57DRAFT_55871 [Xylariaceae sp. FL1272]
MGIHPKLDLQRSSAFSVTPPGLESPLSTVSLPKAADEKIYGYAAPISPPMSNHESSARSNMSPGNDIGTNRDQRNRLNEPPRQQLPSLSSLFAPNQHVRPMNSPVSERPTPLQAIHSPLDRPVSASTNSERPYSSSSSSYFPNVSPTLGQLRPVYEPRLSERRPLPSVAQSFPGPLSPPIREYDAAHHGQRGDVGNDRRWVQTSHSTSRLVDYTTNSRPSTPSFRPASDHRVPLPSLGLSLGYEPGQHRIEGQRQPASRSHSPTSTISANPERVSKDSLGPKIWTGSHFLPRFVRQADVPGEGLCYFYDDGTHCKTVIDGEPVNAHWGVTKAGKPRKRLAIACLTCREKKIKCDPDFPRCVQCEKFGRVCKFKNAPRGGHNTSPTSSLPESQEEHRQLRAPQRPVEPDQSRSVASGNRSPTLGKMGHPSPEIPHLPAKRARYAYEHYPPPPTSFPLIPAPDMKPTSAPWQHRELPRIHDLRKWPSESYLVDSSRSR